MQELSWISIPWIHLAEGEEYPQPALSADHESTAFAIEKGLIDPYPTGYFLPNRAATRAEAIEMLWRIAGKPEPGETAEGFTDLAAGSEHEKAALWAKQTGIYAGEDGKFQGNVALTRGFLNDISGHFMAGAVPADEEAPDTVLTRAELAGASRIVWDAYEAAKAEESPSVPAQ
jgi:hypothetical protein